MYIVDVEGGTRTWNLVDVRDKQRTPDTAPWFILGIMSFVAGLMSFFIGWRWR